MALDLLVWLFCVSVFVVPCVSFIRSGSGISPDCQRGFEVVLLYKPRAPGQRDSDPNLY